MNIKNIKDSLSPNKSIVFHSTSSEDLYDILVNRKFKAGRGGGAMLGPGFYANQYLEQAQKHNYGKLILQAEVSNIDKFFFADYRMYNNYFGKSTKDYAEAITEQLEAKGVPDTKFSSYLRCYPNNGKTSDYISSARCLVKPVHPYVFEGELWEAVKALGFYGLVYYGDYDKASVVCWRLKDVYPIGISYDNGKSWVSSREATKQLVEGNFETSKEENIKSSNEDQRSYQRALDLKKRYEGKPDDVVIKAITNQLSRITDPLKKKIRTRAFKEVFSNLDLSSIPDSADFSTPLEAFDYLADLVLSPGKSGHLIHRVKSDFNSPVECIIYHYDIDNDSDIQEAKDIAAKNNLIIEDKPGDRLVISAPYKDKVGDSTDISSIDTPQRAFTLLYNRANRDEYGRYGHIVRELEEDTGQPLGDITYILYDWDFDKDAIKLVKSLSEKTGLSFEDDGSFVNVTPPTGWVDPGPYKDKVGDFNNLDLSSIPDSTNISNMNIKKLNSIKDESVQEGVKRLQEQIDSEGILRDARGNIYKRSVRDGSLLNGASVYIFVDKDLASVEVYSTLNSALANFSFSKIDVIGDDAEKVKDAFEGNSLEEFISQYSLSPDSVLQELQAWLPQDVQQEFLESYFAGEEDSIDVSELGVYSILDEIPSLSARDLLLELDNYLDSDTKLEFITDYEQLYDLDQE